MMNEIPESCTDFDWNVYKTPTLAGLSPLIPIPLVDWVFEEYFRRQTPRSIAQHHGKALPPEAARALNQDQGCLAACLSLPVVLLVELIKRTLKKLLYFLSIKTASDRISHYWHRAFLIDCMILQDHLTDATSARIARQAMDRALEETSTSPMLSVARRIVSNTKHVYRMLIKARRGEEDKEVKEKRDIIRRHWDDFQDHLATLASRYNTYYAMLRLQKSDDNEGYPTYH
jgi:Mg2+ and Co2+ transporter CorA